MHNPTSTPPADPALIALDELAPHSHQLRILLAAAPPQQQPTTAWLQHFGHIVESQPDHASALAVLLDGHYDAMLLDLPTAEALTLLQACRALYARLPLDCRPPVALVALGNAVDLAASALWQHAGAAYLLAKPFAASLLDAPLRAIIVQRLQQGAALKPLAQGVPSDLDSLFAAPATDVPPRPVPPRRSEQAQQAHLRDVFVRHLPSRLAELQPAIAQRDAALVSRAFHGLRGSICYVADGSPAHQLCARLETAALAADWPYIDATVPELLALLQSLIDHHSD